VSSIPPEALILPIDEDLDIDEEAEEIYGIGDEGRLLNPTYSKSQSNNLRSIYAIRDSMNDLVCVLELRCLANECGSAHKAGGCGALEPRPGESLFICIDFLPVLEEKRRRDLLLPPTKKSASIFTSSRCVALSARLVQSEKGSDLTRIQVSPHRRSLRSQDLRVPFISLLVLLLAHARPWSPDHLDASFIYVPFKILVILSVFFSPAYDFLRCMWIRGRYIEDRG